MIPGASVAQRVKAGIQFRPAGLAHGGTEVSPVEGQALGGQAVDVRGLGILPAIERKIIIGTVVGQNNQEIRLCPCPCDKEKQGEQEK